MLRGAGVLVFDTDAKVIATAAGFRQGLDIRVSSKIDQLLLELIVILTIGLHRLSESFDDQDDVVVQVARVPPVEGDNEMMDWLDEFLY